MAPPDPAPDPRPAARSAARDRLDLLLDPDSFTELGAARRDGVITGSGTVDGRPVCVFSQDVTSGGEAHGTKIVRVVDLALRTGCPLVGLYDGGDAEDPAGLAGLAARGEILRRQTRASGVIPQLALIMGPVTGSDVHSPVLADFVIMVDGRSQLYATAPGTIAVVTGEEVDAEELGGGHVHSTRTGTAHHLAATGEEAIGWARRLLGFLPSNNLEDAPALDLGSSPEITDDDRELDTVLPSSPTEPYDVRRVISGVFDDGDLCEVQPSFAGNLVVGFGRVDGHSVGVVANQPLHRGGGLDADAAEKAARFVRCCDAFNLPVITVVDVPGQRPGAGLEWGGSIRRGSKLITAYAEATVPLVTVITRHAVGSGYLAMGSAQLGADVTLAWPGAQLATTGETDAVPARSAAELGFVDAVITPSRTRLEVTRALRLLRSKRETLPPRKHATVPL